MKQSDLKEYIKEEIISVLSETATDDDIENQKELNKELEKTKELVGEETLKNMGTADIEEMGYKEGENIFSRMRGESSPDLRAYFSGLKQGFLDNLGSYPSVIATSNLNEEKEGMSLRNIGLAELEEMGYEAGVKATYTHATVMTRLQNRPDKSAYSKGFILGVKDELASSTGLNEDIDDEVEADKAASKGAKKEPLGKLAKKLAETEKEMKSVLVKFKKAEGAEKEKHLKRLKELTKIKKELEKSL